jgi:hypothetical protein
MPLLLVPDHSIAERHQTYGLSFQRDVYVTTGKCSAAGLTCADGEAAACCHLAVPGSSGTPISPEAAHTQNLRKIYGIQ